MSVKRLAASLCAVLALLAIAGVLEVSLLVFSSSSEAVASEGIVTYDGPRFIARVESSIIAEQQAQKAWQNEVVVPARSLVEPGFIVVDGERLKQDAAESLVEGAEGFTTRVQFIDQKTVLASGCELVSVAVALHAEGVDAAPADIASHLRKGANVATDYLGDPARNGGGLPPCVVDAANAWSAEHGNEARALNLTGTTFDGVLALAELGYPVVVWTTERLAEPRFSGAVQDGLQWYRPEHCVVVYGVEGDSVLVSDSLEGLVRRDRAQFSHIYEACGNKAVMVQLG